MRYYDITRELFSTPVYPGDPVPEKELIRSIDRGDRSNLTYLKMCVHNSTHMDAPKHFVNDGKTIGEITMEQVMGECAVIACEEELTAEDARRKLEGAGTKKVLLKGMTYFGEETARVFAEAGIELIGVERQTVGYDGETAGVHRILLGSGMVILEGLDLSEVKEGTYFLSAAPLKLAGCEGSPCRPVLIEGL